VWPGPLRTASLVYRFTDNNKELLALYFRIFEQDSLALASMARDDPPASSTATAMHGNVGSEFET